MKEAIVQWVLLREWKYLQTRLRVPLLRRYGEYVVTEQGVLDFVILTADERYPLLVVELETSIDTRGKLDFVQDQLIRYRRVELSSSFGLVLLYAEDVTPPKWAKEIQTICRDLQVEPRTYSLQSVQSLYQRILTKLTKVAGIPLGPTAAMDICYLRWMNRFIKPFVDRQETELPVAVFFTPDGSGIFNSRTAYTVRRRLCEDFELISRKKEGNEVKLVLTDYGERFARAMTPDILVGHSEVPLSPEQKRILIEVLTNGVIRPCKANIYYFLRFVHITGGVWIPKSSAKEPQKGEASCDYWHLANGLFGKSYAWRTLTDFLAFTCNQCEELGLVERVRLQADHDSAVFTPLGSRILGLLELDLHLKRERIQIPSEVV